MRKISEERRIYNERKWNETREMKFYKSRLSTGIYSKQTRELVYSKENQKSEIKFLEMEKIFKII